MKPFSIIIPVYNEAKILRRQVKKILSGINKLNLPVKFEILLVENGSTDSTCRKAQSLVREFKNVRHICLPFPSYGQAFKTGIIEAFYPFIFQFDIDFWDINFIVKSQNLLEEYDFVIGSKNLDNSQDKRPFIRKIISKLLEKAIELRFNIAISDTHGLKAIKKYSAEKLIDKIQSPNHFFDSELLLRLISTGYRFTELPVNLKEIRNSRFSFLIRAKEVLREFITLMSIKLEKQRLSSFSVIPSAKRGTVPEWGLSPINRKGTVPEQGLSPTIQIN